MRSLLSTVVVLAAALLGFACGEAEQPPAEGQDLLQTGPAALFGQPATLGARLKEQWGSNDGGGWWPLGARHADEVYVPSRWQKPKLAVPNVLPAARTLKFKVMGPTPALDSAKAKKPVELTLLLNDKVLLDAFELGTEPQEISVETTAEDWLFGDNTLVFATDRTVKARVGGAGEVKPSGLGLFWVTFGDEQEARFDAEAGKLTLEPGSAARFVWEPNGPVELQLGGKPPRSGELLLDVRLREPGSTAFRPSRGGRAVRPEGGAWPRLPLPYEEGAVMQLELTFDGGDRELVFDSAVLVGEQREAGTPIIFISIDTLAARHLSVYGYERETSPNLERFAEEAILFESCRSNAPITLPSYMSQLSGLYPSPRFDGDEVGPASRFEMLRLGESTWTIAEALKAVGYRTGGWVDNPWLSPSNGFAQGFDHYDTGAMSLNARWDSQGGVEHVTREALAWLDDLQDGVPYFAFLQALDVHGPYVPSEPFTSRFVDKPTLDEDLVLPVIYHRADTFGGIPDYIAKPLADVERPETFSAQKAIDAYDQVVAQMDHNIGILLDELRESGAFDEAIIVFSADHGESMVEHEYYFDHGTLYDESIHVPLIVRMPGGAHGGRRIDQVVQLVDLYPTFLDYAGGKAPKWLHGRTLRPILEGESALDPMPVFSTEGVMAQATVLIDDWKLLVTRPLYGAHPQTILSHPFFRRTGLEQPRDENGELLKNQKLKNYFAENRDMFQLLKKTYKDKSVELFNLKDDPLELRNVAKEHPKKLRELQAMLEMSLGFARATEGVEAAGDVGAAASEVLKGLGYTGGDDEDPNAKPPADE